MCNVSVSNDFYACSMLAILMSMPLKDTQEITTAEACLAKTVSLRLVADHLTDPLCKVRALDMAKRLESKSNDHALFNPSLPGASVERKTQLVINR
jgi:hypothetical protein